MKHELTCVKCKSPFLLEVPEGAVFRKDGRVCPKCVKIRSKQADRRKLKRRRLLPDEPKAYSLEKRSVSLLTPFEVAQRLKVTTDNVVKIERRALAKLREHPELRELFRKWMEDGGHAPVNGLRRLMRRPDERLLEWQMGVSEFWEAHDKLQGLGRRKEALQCRAEIRRFQNLLKRSLRTVGLSKA